MLRINSTRCCKLYIFFNLFTLFTFTRHSINFPQSDPTVIFFLFYIKIEFIITPWGALIALLAHASSKTTTTVKDLFLDLECCRQKAAIIKMQYVTPFIISVLDPH